jgi:hypothetical protein
MAETSCGLAERRESVDHAKTRTRSVLAQDEPIPCLRTHAGVIDQNIDHPELLFRPRDGSNHILGRRSVHFDGNTGPTLGTNLFGQRLEVLETARGNRDLEQTIDRFQLILAAHRVSSVRERAHFCPRGSENFREPNAESSRGSSDQSDMTSQVGSEIDTRDDGGRGHFGVSCLASPSYNKHETI